MELTNESVNTLSTMPIVASENLIERVLYTNSIIYRPIGGRGEISNLWLSTPEQGF